MKSQLPKLNRRRFAQLAVGAAAVAPFNIARAQAARLKIGVIQPTSGPLAQIGQANVRGYEIAQPVLKQLGYPDFEFVFADSESNVNTARAQAERLIGAGVHVLSGAFDSGQSNAIAQVAEQRKLPFVINIAAADSILEQGFKYTFRSFPNSTIIGRDSFELQKQLFQATGKTPKKVVMLHVNDTFGSAQANATKAMLPRFSMPYQIVDYIPYDLRAPDLSVEVSKAKAQAPDMVWVVSRLNDAMLITREMVKQRFNPMGLMSSGPGYYEDQYLRTLGKYGDFVLSTVPWYNPKKPLSQLLIAEWAKKHPNVSIDTNVQYSLEAVLTVVDAFQRAGTTDSEVLTTAIRRSNIQNNCTLAPNISFNEKGQNEGARMACVQNRSGKLKVVLPAEAAEDKPVFPVPAFERRA
jgi:branched-chain amino acid transport system substrate-binding protein